MDEKQETDIAVRNVWMAAADCVRGLAEPETSGADVSSAPETVVPTAPETADQASPALAEEEPTASGPFLPTEEGEGPGKTDE